MSSKAKFYIGAVAATGLAVLVGGLLRWECQDPARFLAYLLLALVASGLKVRLPGLTATMSVSFVFILIGIAELSLSETLLMGCAGAVAQSVWMARTRVRLVRLVFSVAVIAIAAAAGYSSYHSPFAERLGSSLPLLLPLAALIFFVANTAPVAMVISLAEGRNVRTVWRDCYFWTFPYYLAGAALAGLIHVAGRAAGWKSPLLLLPLAYFIYWFYRLYLERCELETARLRQANAVALKVGSSNASLADGEAEASVRQA